MKIKASLLYAWRLLFPKSGGKSNARRSLIGAVFCIGLSLVPLVVVLVVSDGMISGITSRFIELSSYHMQVQTYGISTKKGDYAGFRSLADSIEEVDGITDSFVERQSVGLLAGDNGRQGVTIRAIEPALLNKGTAFSKLLNVHEGELNLSDSRSILVGKKIAETLGVKVGSKVRLITTRSQTGGKITPRVTAFTVKGIVSSGYQELDALWVFIPVETGFDLIPAESADTIIGIETEDAFSNSFLNIQNAVEEMLPRYYRLFSWTEINETQYENFASTKSLLLFIMFLIVLVASVNVSSALVMLVMERRKEIAVLKSLGASSEGISAAFIFTGFCTGLLGVATGIPIGILCAVNVNQLIIIIEKIVNTLSRIVYNISNNSGYVQVHLLDPAYYLETIPVVVPFTEIFLITVGTLLLSIIVSIIPSIRAGRDRPINTLRKI